jgi:DNA-binding winged helix-turn-helix (wHTH) protein
MNPRVLAILDRLESLNREKGKLCAEELVLQTELRVILEENPIERAADEEVDFSMFKDTTRRLLIELWDAPDKMISHQDIREDVIFDEEASDQAVKNVIARARYELAEAHAKFTIENVFGKGFQLVPKSTKHPKQPRK